MPIVNISESLAKEILRKFNRADAEKITDYLESLEIHPNRGKIIGRVGSVVIKELKYKSFRFYCIYDGNAYNAFLEDSLVELLFRFVRMSNKKQQQKVIGEIKDVLRKIGPSGL